MPRKPTAKTVDEDFINDSVDNNDPSRNPTKKQKKDPNVVDGKRQRVASSKQGKIDDDATAKQREKYAKLEKENQKLKIKLLKAAKDSGMKKASLGDSDDNGFESEDPPEIVAPFMFSSSIKSLGVVDGTPPKKLRKQVIGQAPAGPALHAPLATTTNKGKGGGTSSKSNVASGEDVDTDNKDDDATINDGDQTARCGRKRSRTNSRASSRRTRASSSESPASSDQDRLELPGFRAGVIPNGKPKASDYEDPVKHRLLKAMDIYETFIFVGQAYPSQELQLELTKEAWGYASEDAAVQYQLDTRMERLMKDRGSRARGFLKDIIRPHIETAFGFTPSTNKKVIQKNVIRHLELMEGRIFHYKDPETRTGYAENAIIKKILREAFFRRKDDRGIRHLTFNPIPLRLIALILTVIEHCIGEWSTGSLVKAKFEESVAAPCYIAHLENLENWRNLNPKVVDKILETLYKRCSRSVGVLPVDSVPAMSEDVKEAARKELEARTGDTESESDA